MQLPIGIIAYWANRLEEDHAVISGMWYFQEMYVPSTKEEKLQSIADLKAKRCTVINIHGSFNQIVDLLSQGDRYINAQTHELKEFDSLIKKIEVPSNKAFLFDDVYHPKGTALTIDTAIEVEETMDEVHANISFLKPVDIYISKDWSLSREIIASLEGEKDHVFSDYKARMGLNKEQETTFEEFTEIAYSAAQILNEGFTYFEEFVYELTDDYGNEIAPLLKSLYLASKDWLSEDQITLCMDSAEDVYATDTNALIREKENTF